MEVDFYDWRAWVVLIILVFIVLWIYMKMTDDATHSRTKTSAQDSVPPPSYPDVETFSDTVTCDDPKTTEEQEITRLPVVLSLTREEAREHDTIREQQKQGQSAGERECIKVFRELYGSDVIVQTRKCDWLINPMTGRALELDVFSPGAMVACEYDGAQHRKVVPRFHPHGVKSLEYQQWKDRYKDAACKHRGVHLIRVPDTIHIKEIRQYILERLPRGRVTARKTTIEGRTRSYL